MDDIEVYNNIIHDTYGPGIWLYNYDTSSYKELGKNVHIHHNTFYNTGTNTGITWVGGIITSGFHDILTENNVFDCSYHAAVANMCPGSCPSYSSKSGYTTIVRNNIIVNTQKRIYSPSGTGYGVINYLTNKNHKFVLQNNCLYKNAAGNYKSCTSTTDIYVNPLFADQKNHDYHLKSTVGRWNGKTWVKDTVISPCIDAGYSSSAYSSEPKPNGNRINIGTYGNTAYASLSSTSRVKTVQCSLMNSITADENETGENLNITAEALDTDEDNFTDSEPDPSMEVGESPVIESIPEFIVKVGENLNYTVKASSVNGNSLTFSALDLPAGASFDETGLFSWTPLEEQEGTYTIYLEVNDGMFSDSEVATINVIEEKVPFDFSGRIYDNRLREASPEDILSDKAFIDVGGMSGVGRYRDLIWFNVSDYTNDTEIKNATLSLFWYYPSSSRPNDTVLEIYRPVAWNPDYVSWNKKNSGIAWNNSGGDWYDKNGVLQGNTPYATLTLNASSLPDNNYCELNATDIVKEYISGKYPNTGFLIKARNENDNYIAFYSAECENVSQVPRLNLTYS